MYNLAAALQGISLGGHPNGSINGGANNHIAAAQNAMALVAAANALAAAAAAGVQPAGLSNSNVAAMSANTGLLGLAPNGFLGAPGNLAHQQQHGLMGGSIPMMLNGQQQQNNLQVRFAEQIGNVS